ncbi:hypothetical protein C2R22_14260 [Salinigranum rubrum]|uniref:CARDB domain-containing protein n=1 Tax=Salinigranum rubrum TaxID=755307 RepID=A0A2I8VL45_9EURY|nr:hypothetical protein [Salinigranum rubrum]AUV82660.1 hypothetical protein C2R22_14260 [Salinigranum rubrum]
MSPRRRSAAGAAAFAIVLLLCGVATVTPPTAAQSSSVVVTNATHTPTTPAAGDTFEVRATIRNQAGAAGPFTVNEVAVEVPGGGPGGRTSASDLGVLSPGTSMEVGLSATVDEPGWHQLNVLVYGQTTTGRAVRVAYPVTVQVVEPQRPQIDAEFDDGVVGAESPVDLTVANGLSTGIRNVQVELMGENVRIDRPRRVGSALGSEAEANYTFDVTPTRAGDQRLTARLTYTDASGERRTTEETFRYAVEPLERDVRLDVATVRGGDPAVEVTVVNLGNADVEDVAITGASGDATLSTALVDRVEPRDTETVRLNVTDLAAVGPELTVRAAYEVAGERHEATRTVRGVFVPGRIELTGIEVTQTEAGSVRVTGTASNVGTTDVQAVTVSVRAGDAVGPVDPGAEYFVGAVDASDFASFTLNAQVDAGNETTIPLEVRYLVDGDERTRTVEATYDPPETPERRGSGFPLVGVGVVLALVVAGAFLWRRRRAA